MAVTLRNVSPLGQLDFPLLRRVLEPGETFEVDDDVAGRAPSTTRDPDTGELVVDPGEGLLAQVGNFAEVGTGNPSLSWRHDQLLAHARAAGVEVDDKATKAEILAAIEQGPTPTVTPTATTED